MFGFFEQIWKDFADYQVKTNYWKNQLQWTVTTEQLQMTTYNKQWLPTTIMETTANSKELKICSNMLKITKNITKLKYWFFKSKSKSSKQQNNSWNVQWLLIAHIIVIQESLLLTIRKISYIPSISLLRYVILLFNTKIMLMQSKLWSTKSKFNCLAQANQSAMNGHLNIC